VWAATYILMGLRYSAALTAQVLQGVLSMRESTTYQAILREGREEGREEGRRTEAARILLLTGEGRFGAPDPASRAALENISDVKRLEDMITRVFSAAGWQELLELSSPRRRNGRRRRSS